MPRKRPTRKSLILQRQRHDLVDLLRRGPAERRDVLLRDHRIVQRVVLVVELDDRARQRLAFLQAEARRQRAGGDVAHDHLERDDLDLADQLLAHVEAPHEVRRHADLAELREDVLGDAVVEHALAFDQRVLLVVERGGVILEMLDESAGLRTFVKHLGLALVDATPLVHSWTSEDQQIVLTHCDRPNFSRALRQTLTP